MGGMAFVGGVHSFPNCWSNAAHKRETAIDFGSLTILLPP
jgi:hypothetical protein